MFRDYGNKTMDSMPNTHHSTRTSAPDDPLLDYPDSLIINPPDLKSRALIFGEEILTIIFWGFWFYLWLPLISVIAWLFGFSLLYTHMVKLGGFDGFLDQIDTFTTGIILVSGSLALWSLYNLKRYGAYNRRNKILVTDLDKLTEDFSITAQDLNRVQQAKIVSFFFDEHNEISKIDTTAKEKFQ